MYSSFQWAFELGISTDFSRTEQSGWYCSLLSCKLLEASFGLKTSKMQLQFQTCADEVQILSAALGWCTVIYSNMYVCFWAPHLPNSFSLIDWQLGFQTSHIIRSVTVNFVPHQFTSSEETMEPWVMVPELESNIIEYNKFTLECVWLILSFYHLHHNGRATGHAWFLALIGDNFARMGMRCSGNNYCLTSYRWI